MASLISSYDGYFETIPSAIDGARWVYQPVTADFNGDGHEDLLLLGASYPAGGNTAPANEPGMLLLGNGAGFTPAPQSLFPWQQLTTVHPRKVLLEDFNADGRTDVFIASHGWDTAPFPGEQNQLWLSSPGGYVNATSTLPQLSDFTHTAASADIDRDGDLDIFVGNGYAGQNGILSYMLVNNGSGQFSMTRANIPVGTNEVMDFNAPHHFPGANFADLNGDGLPELILTAEASQPYDKLRENVILWNQGGSYDNAHKTFLPATQFFNHQIALDVAGMDINADGRQDLVVTGTQGQPYYDGWWVQVLLQQADGSFADSTNAVMASDVRFGGTPGAGTGTPWGMWVKPMDFNADGFEDFAIEFNGLLNAGTPLVWLNDGTGHFTTIKAGDITHELWRLGGGHWYETEEGWSIVTTQGYDAQDRIILAGATANTPYTGTPDSGMARTGGAGDDRLRGDDAANTLTGNGGIDTAVYFGHRGAFTVDSQAAAHFTVTRNGSADVDTLLGVERIEFRDMKVAMDLDGHAGQVARILGAVFTPEAVGNAGYAGIGLELLDGGMSYEALVALALQVALGATATHEDVVTLLYTNVVGAGPTPADLDFFVDLLQSGQFTRSSLGVFAADSGLNADSIGLAGLAETGLVYA